MEGGLHDERLKVVGEDGGAAAAGETGASVADVPALAVAAGTADHLVAARGTVHQPGEEVAPRRAVGGAVGVAQDGAQSLGLLGLDDGLPLRLAHQLSQVLALPTEPVGHEHVSERLDLPRRTRDRAHLAVSQVRDERAEAVAPEDSVGELADDGCLRRIDGAAVGLVAVRARPAASYLAVLRELLVLALDAAALVVALLSGHGPEYAGEESAVVGGQVGVAGDRGQLGYLRPVADFKEFLKLLRLTVEAVLVPDDHRIALSSPDVSQKLLIRGPRLALVCADVIVDVDPPNRPTAPGCQGLAVLNLALHPELESLAVGGDPGIDRSASGHLDTLAHTGTGEGDVTRRAEVLFCPSEDPSIR